MNKSSVKQADKSFYQSLVLFILLLKLILNPYVKKKKIVL